jgi:hypothetical protein
MLHEVPAGWLPQARQACQQLLFHIAQRAVMAPKPDQQASLAVIALRLAAAAYPKNSEWLE